MATVIIFVLLGASLEPADLGAWLLPSLLAALLIVLIARPLAVLPVLVPAGWGVKRALFVALEGPRGVVPAALAGLAPLPRPPVSQHPAAALGPRHPERHVVTVLVSVTLETLWVGWLNRRLLGGAPRPPEASGPEAGGCAP